ncbi:hypothetical protein HG531_005317 [Fusarium graminearum]|nr:hypothetical protein HG531_005317 [Fusarium graminearum]
MSSRGHFLKSSSELFLLLLALHHGNKLGVARLLVVNTTLGLVLALPSAGSLIFALLDRDGGVPVADRLVALIEESVVGDVVLLDVCINLLERPSGQGVDLDNTTLIINLDDGDGAAGSTLRSSATVEDGSNLELIVRSLKGLNLDNPVIHFASGVPHLLAVHVLEFFGVVDTVRLVNVNGNVGVPGLDSVDEVVCLLEVVQGIQEDEVDSGSVGVLLLNLGEHVHGGETGQAKSSRLVQVREHDLAESENVHGVHVLKHVVEVVNMGLCESDSRKSG